VGKYLIVFVFHFSNIYILGGNSFMI